MFNNKTSQRKLLEWVRYRYLSSLMKKKNWPTSTYCHHFRVMKLEQTLKFGRIWVSRLCLSAWHLQQPKSQPRDWKIGTFQSSDYNGSLQSEIIVRELVWNMIWSPWNNGTFCGNTDAVGEKHVCEERKWADRIQKMWLERRAAQLDTILITQQHCRGWKKNFSSLH